VVLNKGDSATVDKDSIVYVDSLIILVQHLRIVVWESFENRRIWLPKCAEQSPRSPISSLKYRQIQGREAPWHPTGGFALGPHCKAKSPGPL